MTQWNRAVKTCRHCGHAVKDHGTNWDYSLVCFHVDCEGEHKKMCNCRIIGCNYTPEEHLTEEKAEEILNATPVKEVQQ